MSNIIDKILVSGVTYDLPSGGSGSTTVELTQAEYDALVSGGTVDPDTYYIITDATPQDMSQYWTSAQTNSAITQAVSGKQDTLIAGDNITISGNVISASGGGSVTVDSELSTTSENPVQNKVVTAALNGKGETLQWDATSTARKDIPLRLKRGNSVLSQQALQLGDYLQYGSPTSSALCITGLTPTSAITSSVTSASTDSQVPSAKAVYDALQEGSGGITSGEVQSMIDESVSGKQDTLSAGTNITITDNVISAQLEGGTVSRGDVEDMIEEATSGLQETLSAGTGIEIDSANTISCTVSGKTYSAGTNISIDANDTINCTLPISAFNVDNVVVVGKNNTAETQSYNDYIIGSYSKIDGKGVLSYSYGNNKIFGSSNQIHKGSNNLCVGNSNSIGIDGYEASQNNCVVGSNNTISPFIGNTTLANRNYVYGYDNKIDKKSYNYVVGSSNTVSGGNSCNILGSFNIPMNDNEVILGRYNNSVSDGTTSGNTLFSVGNGTADNARHNAFEIRQNGDIYITSGETDIKLQDHLGGGGSITIDPSLDSGSTNAVANSAITLAIANATDGRLKEDLVFSGKCGYGTIHTDVGWVGDEYLIIKTYPSTKISFAVFRSSNKNYRYEIVIQDIATKDTYRAYYNYTYDTIKSSGGTGINYATVRYVGYTQTFTANDGYRIIGLVRDMAGSGREHYGYICTYNANIPSGTTLSELYGYITNVNANLKGLTKMMNSAIDYQSYTDDYGGELYYQQTVFPTNNSFTAHTASTVMHTTQAEKDSWNGKLDASAITTNITSSSTDSEVPSAKAVYDQLGGMKIVKLTESEYAALVTKDSNTLYVVIPDPSN